MGSDKFCLKWNDYQKNLNRAFQTLRESEVLFDVTLVCEDVEEIQAHQVILAACSPLFNSILTKNQNRRHPLLYLKGVSKGALESILDFMYYGEANVLQERLNSFLAVAEELRVKGLCQDDGVPNKEVKEKRRKIERKSSKDLRDNVKSDLLVESDSSQAFYDAKHERQSPVGCTEDDIHVISDAVASAPSVIQNSTGKKLHAQSQFPLAKKIKRSHSNSPVASPRTCVTSDLVTPGHPDLQRQMVSVKGDDLDVIDDDVEELDYDYSQNSDTLLFPSPGVSTARSSTSLNSAKVSAEKGSPQHIRRDLADCYERVEDPNGMAFFSCLICGKTAARKDSLLTHIENCHFPGSYVCQLCNQTFNSQNTLTVHVRRKHVQPHVPLTYDVVQHEVDHGTPPATPDHNKLVE